MDNARQPFASVRKEISYMDMQGNTVRPRQAVKILTKEYDEQNSLIQVSMHVDFSKVNEPQGWFFNLIKS